MSSRAASCWIACHTTQHYHANSARQVYSIVGFNLMQAMQAGTTERRSTNRKRRTIRPFQTIQTFALFVDALP